MAICSHASIDSLIVSELIEKTKPNMPEKWHNSHCSLIEHNRNLYLFINVLLKQVLKVFLLAFIQVMNQHYQAVDAHLPLTPIPIQVPYNAG